MKKFLIELLIGTISSAIAAWLIASAFGQFLWKYQITDRDPVFAGVLIGMPLGCLLAVFFIRKYIYKIKPFNLLRVLLSVLVSWFVGILGILILAPLVSSMIVFDLELSLLISLSIILSIKSGVNRRKSE